MLSLDAAWGTGKTTFVRMWRQHLQNELYKTVYFNAWETDYIADPLVALVGEIGSLLPPTRAAAQKTYRKLKSTTSVIIKKATPIAVRLLTAGLVDVRPEDLRGLGVSPEDLEKALSETAERVVEKAIDEYRRNRDEVEEFRKTLEQAVAQVAGAKALVFFVDELDRCRPTFAVELLERIKHLLEVPGVVFVFSVHLEQLAHSLKAIYGQDFDAEGYLGRFFHLGYRLADPTPKEYAKYLVKQLGIGDWQAVNDRVAFLMSYLGFSLRQQQRCLTRTALVLRILGQGHRHDDPVVYAALLVVREWKPRLYAQFLTGERTADDILGELEAADPYRWRLEAESAEMEARLLGLEGDRRESMNREDKQPWTSARLQDHRKRAESGDKRSARVVEHVEGYLQRSQERFCRLEHWRRVLKVLELGGEFQLLGEQLR